jgi:hypothetical protein
LVYEVDYNYDILKAYYVNRWAVDGNHEAFHISGVFISRLAVCAGIADAFSLLCAIEGINVERVTGWAYSEAKDQYVGHAWNKVETTVPGNAEKEWYLCDATWGSVAATDEYDNVEAEYLTHSWFLLDDAHSSEHKQDDMYTSPDIRTLNPIAHPTPEYHAATTEFDYYAEESKTVTTYTALTAFIEAHIAVKGGVAVGLEVKLNISSWDGEDIRDAIIAVNINGWNKYTFNGYWILVGDILLLVLYK